MLRASFLLLLRIYPASVRREYGPAILETVEARLDSEDGLVARSRAGLREAAGLLVAALQARLSRRRQPPARGPHIPRQRARPMNGFLQDLRYALRTAVRDPGYSLVVICTLALGIGANTAVFSVVDGVLLEPLPYAHADRLVRVQSGWGTMTKALQVRFRQSLHSLDDVAGYVGWGFIVGGDDSPEEVSGGVVSANYFDLLGARPLIGRTFVPDDAEPGNDDVVILSHALWQRRFGADPGILGRRVAIDNEQHSTYVIIGVMPPDYRPLGDWQLWTPYQVDPTDARDFYSSWYVQLVGRLAAGADEPAATHELVDLMLRLESDEDAYGLVGFDGVEDSRVTNLLETEVGPVRSSLLILLAAVGLVLLIACVNVANLQLARSTARRRELAVRGALGARRGRLIRQLATEAVVLSLFGAALGAAGAAGLLGGLRRALTDFVPRADGVNVDATVLGATAAIAVLAGLAFGTVPGWSYLRRADGLSPAGSRRGHSAGVEEGRASRALVAAELALACVIVVGAGLMMRTLVRLWSVPPGFDPRGVVTLRVNAPNARYRDGSAQTAFWTAALERVAAVPGVQESGAIHLMPLAQDGNWSFPFLAEGQVAVDGEPLPVANFRIVSPGYFRAMRVPLLEGRSFDSRDGGDSAGVVIVNRRLAEEYWPGESAVGKGLKQFGSLPLTVVGVVGDVRQFTLDREPMMEMYRPYSQWPTASMVVAVRSERPAAVIPAVREALHQVEPGAPVYDVASMSEVMAGSMSSTRFTMFLLSGFAGLALLLGAVGVYGVMSYVVSWRTREIGIRMALGARSSRVQRSVIASAMRPVVAGIALGLVAALASLRVMASLLYGIAPTDPVTYAAVAGLLGVIGLLGAWLPARRAARVDPLRALAAE